MSDDTEFWADYKKDRADKKASNLEYSTNLLKEKSVSFISKNGGCEKVPKYKIGDRVVYDGLIGIVEGIQKYPEKRIGYNLVAEENKELTTSAMEGEIELYTDQELDQEKRLLEAHIDSKRIQNTVINFKEESRDKYD